MVGVAKQVSEALVVLDRNRIIPFRIESNKCQFISVTGDIYCIIIKIQNPGQILPDIIYKQDGLELCEVGSPKLKF